MGRAFVFPGQGSQVVGMGQALAAAHPAARDILSTVDEALGQDLTGLMFNGPQDTLTLTENAQPALMAVSLAALAVLEQECGVRIAAAATFVAGHSLGEYSALAAAGALTVADTARLLRARGRAMQQAVAVGEGAMAAVLGLDVATAETIAAAAADQVCAVANDNAPGQVVVSGHRAAIERAIALAGEAGAKRCLLLPVSAPFHCALMQPAADAMARALAETPVAAPRPALIANVTARAVTAPVDIKRLLVEQVTARVRWRESVEHMVAAGVDTFIELGAGKVLSGLIRRIDRGATVVNLGAPDDLDSVKQAL